MKKAQLKNIIKEEFEKAYSITNDPNVEFSVERIMKMMKNTVHGMMDSSAHIEKTLRSHPDLEYKVRDVEMLLRDLNHQLSVLEEKFEF